MASTPTHSQIVAEHLNSVFNAAFGPKNNPHPGITVIGEHPRVLTLYYPEEPVTINHELHGINCTIAENIELWGENLLSRRQVYADQGLRVIHLYIIAQGKSRNDILAHAKKLVEPMTEFKVSLRVFYSSGQDGDTIFEYDGANRAIRAIGVVEHLANAPLPSFDTEDIDPLLVTGVPGDYSRRFANIIDDIRSTFEALDTDGVTLAMKAATKDWIAQLEDYRTAGVIGTLADLAGASDYLENNDNLLELAALMVLNHPVGEVFAGIAEDDDLDGLRMLLLAIAARCPDADATARIRLLAAITAQRLGFDDERDQLLHLATTDGAADPTVAAYANGLRSDPNALEEITKGITAIGRHHRELSRLDDETYLKMARGEN